MPRTDEQRAKAAAYERERRARLRAQGLSSRTGEPLKQWRFVAPATRLRKGMTVTEDGCWLPAARALSTGGYGIIRAGEQTLYAHRVMWEDQHGSVLANCSLRNICGTKRCINPDHWVLSANMADLNPDQQALIRALLHAEANRKPDPER